MRLTARRIVALAAVSLLLLPALPARADDRTPAERAVDWLAARAFRAFPDYDIEAISALGIDPAVWPARDDNVLDASEAALDERAPPVRHLHAVSLAGYERPDLVQEVLATPADGGFGGVDTPPWNAFGILALRAAGVPEFDARIQAAADRLLSLRGATGGWTFSNSTTAPSETDETGYVLAALTAAGRDVRGDVRAAAFLNTTHVIGGGHDIRVSPKANCQSTVWALHGYDALGIPPPSDDITFLLSLQRPDGEVVLHAGDPPSPDLDESCTAEAAIVLANAHYPRPGIGAIDLPTVPAREAATLALPSAYTSAHWTFADGTTADGTRVAHVFPTAGNETVRIDARGPHAIHRGDVAIRVTSARPVLGAFPANVTLARHAPLTLDLRSATDPDGRIVAFGVDWGDGSHATNATTHAYDRPGNYGITVRAQDDAGGWSDPASFVAIVQNAAPILSAPARLAADRIHVATIESDATDPDGDNVTIHWSLAHMHGEGSPRFTPDTLGNLTVEIVATDPFGGEARTSTILEVVDLPPTIAIDASRPDREVTANASDPDGPPPMISWWIDDTVASPPIRLGPGEHLARAVATDADGATAEASARVNVSAPRAPPVPPRIDDLAAWLDARAMHVRFAAEGNTTIRWRSDVGEGSAPASPSMEIPLANATWASATLVAERDGLETTRETGLLVPPPARPTPPAPPTPSPMQVAPLAAPSPAPIAAHDVALEPASVKDQQAGAQRQTPAAPWILAVLLAMLGRRAR